MRRLGRLVTVMALGFVGVLLQAYADPIADLLWAPGANSQPEVAEDLDDASPPTS